MEEPGGLQSMGSRRVGHDWATSLSLFTFLHWRRKWQPTPVFLSGESQGQRSLVGCRLWGLTELKGEISTTIIGDFNTLLSIMNKTSAAAAAKSLQSCPTLCDLIDGSPLGSSVPGILQARILEWVAISFSKAWKWEVKVKLLSHVRLLVTPWTAAYQAPPSMGFSRQGY